MTTTDTYINTQLHPLRIDESILSVQGFFDRNGFSHFPVTEEGVYVGCLSAEDAHTLDSDKVIGTYKYVLEPFFVREQTNWLDVIEKFAQNETDIMPVLSQENTYLGYYRLFDVVQILNQTSFLREPGGIIVLEKSTTQYSAIEIAQIVENSNHKLLGMFVTKIDDMIQVYIKVNADNLNELLQSFRRYGYEIISEHSEDTYIQSLKDRLNYIEKYLNI
jgi:Mg/Co/Ni transporter MgtE